MRYPLYLRVLMLLLALVCLCTPALADPCVQCGQEADKGDYLCTDCLVALLAPQDMSGGLSLDAPVLQADGSVHLTWQDKQAAAPYTVRYALLAQSPVPFGWTAAEGLTDMACTLSRLAPGTSYLITVVDAQGHEASIPYYAPTPATDNPIAASIRCKTIRYARQNHVEHQFSADEILTDTRAEYGLRVEVIYGTLIRERSYAFALTLEAPNGYIDVIYSGSLVLESGNSTLAPWYFIPVKDYYTRLEHCYGAVPTGEYRVTLHFDGAVVDSATFRMFR